MPAAQCHHCQSVIVDYSSIVDVRGQLFCCNNCRLVSRGRQEPGVPGTFACAHCGSPILDNASMVEHQRQPFCCYNCAAMQMTLGRRTRPLALA